MCTYTYSKGRERLDCAEKFTIAFTERIPNRAARGHCSRRGSEFRVGGYSNKFLKFRVVSFVRFTRTDHVRIENIAKREKFNLPTSPTFPQTSFEDRSDSCYYRSGINYAESYSATLRVYQNNYFPISRYHRFSFARTVTLIRTFLFSTNVLFRTPVLIYSIMQHELFSSVRYGCVIVNQTVE